MEQTRYAAGSRRSRGGGLALAILVHLGLVLLLIAGLAPTLVPLPRQAALPVVFLPLLPPPPPHVAAVRPRLHPGGGAPARAAPPPPAAPLIPHPHVDRPAPLATTDPIALSVAPLPDAASAASEAGAAAGSGTGKGGDGTGDGVGPGPGSGSLAGLMRAVWLYRPTSEEVRPYWPSGAVRDHRNGEVLLACYLPVPGVPRRCVTIRESPRHFGFGAAAVRLSVLFRIKPVTRGGDVAGGWVIVPVSFDFVNR